MTSEGHHAGQPPADATSGGPAEQFGDDGFPPDSEGQARAGFPTSYAPPPHATPNGGSPFVVPTVFGQSGSPESDSAGSLPTRYPAPAGQPGQAPPADPADRTTPPPFPPPTTGSARVPGAGESAPLPQRTSGLPQRTPATSPPLGSFPIPSGSSSSGAQSIWAPRSTASATPAEPHPYRADESDSGGFTGFAPGSPTRGRAGLDDADQAGSGYDRPDTLGSFERSGSQGDRPGSGSPFDRSRSQFDQPGAAGGGFEPQAPLGRPGSLPERPVSGDSDNDRPPGLSAFGDQRVRVPGATLTGLPDAPPPGRGGSPEAPGFSSQDRSEQGFAASASVPSSPGQSPFGGEPSGDEPFRRPPTDVPADEQQYARPPAGGSVFGRPAADSPYGQAAGGESVFGRSAQGDSPFARQADDARTDNDARSGYEAYSGNDGASPFAQPPTAGQAYDGSAWPGAQPTGGPVSPTHDAAAAGRPDTSPFGGFEPGTPDGNGFGGPRSNPDAQGTAPSTSLFGGFVPRGSAPRSTEPGYGTDGRDPGVPGYGEPGGGAPYGSDAPGSGAPSYGSAGPGANGPGYGSDAPGSGAPNYGSASPSASGPSYGSAGFGGDDNGLGARNGFAQRVPGASFAAAGPPDTAEPRNGAAPQPPDRPAVGSARAVSASASVPTTNRVAPSDAEEVPPQAAAPQARVYGRPTQPSDDDDPEPAESAYPSSAGPPVPPGRVAGRATASARVAPPGSDPAAPPQSFGEPTTDVAGRSKPPATPDHYAESTSDISHRGPGPDQPYVPAPALPPMYARPPLENGFPPPPDADQDQERPDRPRMGGMFPGPATRATVTPPSPDQTSSWPGVEAQGPANDTEMSRFEQFRPDADATAAKPETPHVRMLPVLISVIVGAALLVGLAFGIVWLISRGSDSNAGISVAAGDCVKRSGDEAVKATCGDAGAFQVVSIADTKEQCADPGQPYVLNPTSNGKTQVLCLKPTS